MEESRGIGPVGIPGSGLPTMTRIRWRCSWPTAMPRSGRRSGPAGPRSSIRPGMYCEHCGIENETLKAARGGWAWWCASCGAENDRVPEAPYDGSRNPAAEDATARRLVMVGAAFDRGDWNEGADYLSPIGAPGWAAYPGEPDRLLAFRPDNCIGTAQAWKRLLSHRLDQLPEEIATIVQGA